MKKLAPEFISLTQDACWKAFWTKDALRLFLKQHAIPESYLQTWNKDETKKTFIAQLFSHLTEQNKDDILFSLAQSLAEMQYFPDLENYEDSNEKKGKAKEAVARLRTELTKINTSLDSEKQKQQRRMEAEKQKQKAIAKQASLTTLTNQLNSFVSQQGTAGGGFAFEKWFYECVQFFDIDSRPPYKTENNQIDGSLTIDGTTFLVELKFGIKQTGQDDIILFINKITKKADNTMGIFLSMPGYTESAIKSASVDRTPLLLLDHSHLYNLVLSGRMSLDDVIRRIKRHASQTGISYLSPEKF